MHVINYTIVKFLLIFSKCSLALIRSAAIELVRISVEPEVVMLTAPSLMCSSELSTFKSADFLSGDGDLKAKLCDGECCMPDGLIVADDVCGIIAMAEAADETGIVGCMCEGGGMFCGDIRMPPL